MAIQKADANTTNPVDLTAQDINDIKAKLALNNVENTADANKVVSNPTQAALNNKVDKVTGKGLSTNDFTDANQQKLSDAVESDTTSITGAGQVVNLVSITQSNYDNLTPDSQTVYIITDA